MDAAIMLLELHDRGIHVVWTSAPGPRTGFSGHRSLLGSHERQEHQEHWPQPAPPPRRPRAAPGTAPRDPHRSRL